MPQQKPVTQFGCKTWMYAVQTAVAGFFALFGLLSGPLFLTGLMKSADGRPGTDAGIALTVIGSLMLVALVIGVLNLVARSRPVIRLFREGIELNMVGVSTSPLDAITIGPAALRAAWLVVSRGLNRQMVRVPWQAIEGAQITGPPMARTMTLATWAPGPAPAPGLPPVPIAYPIPIQEATFDSPLDYVSAVINAYCQHPPSRDALPAWGDAIPEA